MFGFGKNKNKNDNKKKPVAAKGQTDREALIAEAMANAQKAREEIGEENIQKMAAELKKMQARETGQPDIQNTPVTSEDKGIETAEGRAAKRRIQDMDKRVVASHLRDIIDEDKL